MWLRSDEDLALLVWSFLRFVFLGFRGLEFVYKGVVVGRVRWMLFRLGERGLGFRIRVGCGFLFSGFFFLFLSLEL